MKKIITTIFATVISVSTFAQNPSSTILSTNFDDAFTDFSGSPKGWVAANILASGVVTKAAGYGESAGAAKIVTSTLTFNPAPNIIPTTSGILLTGKLAQVGFSYTIIQGTPYTSRPEGMAYWAKYSPVNTDSAFCYLLLTKWNGTTSKRDTIGKSLDIISSPIAVWTKRTLPIIYSNLTDNPDTINIVFSSSSKKVAQLQSTFTVDEIILYPTGTSNLSEIQEKTLLISPNPAKDFLTITHSNSSIQHIKIFDVTGKVVIQEKINNNSNQVNISVLNNGLYFIIGTDNQNNVVSKNKFEVIN